MVGESNADAARPTAFLSYARADQDRAAKLARALEVAGVDLWWDTMIEGGAAFAKSIEAALENSNAVIVVWSAASVGSDWVLDEAAKGRDLRKLVPVTFDGTEAPLGFRQYQAIDLSHWRGDPARPGNCEHRPRDPRRDRAGSAPVTRGTHAAARLRPVAAS